MEKKIKDLEDSIHLISEKLNQIEKRISSLEQKDSLVSKGEPDTLSKELGKELSLFPKILPGVSKVKILSVIGRTFLVLAGAFLLRVFTENETFIPILGAAIGLIYSIIWLYFAYRAAGKEELISASFHGISSVLIAFPLIFEASTKLNIFSPVQTILLLFVLTGLALFVAVRRNLRSLYVFYILAALFTAVPLMISSGKVGLFNVFILIIGLITISIKYFKEWHILPWIAAFFGNIAVAFLASLASSPEKLIGRYSDVSVTFSLIFIIFYMIIYLSGFITATLYLKRQISIFGIFQSLFVLIIGLIGTISISHGTGIGYSILGLFTLVFALGFYLIAFILLKTKEKINFYYYSWMAFILSVASIWILSNENTKIISLGILSLVSILMTRYSERFTTLSVQSGLYLFLAVGFSNLLELSILSLISAEYSMVVFSSVIIFTLVLTIVVYTFHILFGTYKDQKIQIPRFLVLLITLLGFFGFIISISTNSFALKDETLQLNLLALIRTITLAISAITLAWLSNKSRLFELSYLVYPILIIGGLKLLFEDLGSGTPITLFIGFTFYGIALITAPKIKYKVKKSKVD